MRICDMCGVLLQERVILAGPIFYFHFQLLEHACGGLKYEIQSKAFSEMSSENSSTGSGIHMYTWQWQLSLWKILILTAGEFVKRSHKGTCTSMIWKSRGDRFLHTGSVYTLSYPEALTSLPCLSFQAVYAIMFWSMTQAIFHQTTEIKT